MDSSAYFCGKCDVPILNNSCERCMPISTTHFPLKAAPVFKEELKMLTEVTGEPINEFGSLELWTANRYYYYHGQKIFRVIGGNILESPKIQWIKDKNKILKETRRTPKIKEKEVKKRVREANRFSLGTLEERAVKFIKETQEIFSDKTIYTAISFSGGKDSAVVSHLVRKALGNNKILHIFADTTLETIETLEYIKRFAEQERIFLIKRQPVQIFTELVKKAKLPSRIHRWCCDALKTSPIEFFLKMILEPGEKILTFDGIRREESNRRENYEEISYTTKVSSNIIARPIINWSSLEEWLYILSQDILLNQSYRSGYRRVGCTLCPFSPEYDEFLTSFYSQKDKDKRGKWDELIDLVWTYAKDRNIPNTNEFVANGKWKTRAGSFKKNDILVVKGQLNYEDIILNFEQSEFDKLKEYLKPLGKLFWQGNIALILDKNEIVAKIKYSREEELLHIFIYNPMIKSDILRQVRKAKFCINCGLCLSKCPVSAINGVAGFYRVNDFKCIQCNICVKGTTLGCVIANSLDASFKTYDCHL